MSFTRISPARVNPAVTHPHEQRVSISGTWRFKLDPEDRGLPEKWFADIHGMTEQIIVPGCWQGQGFGSQENNHVWDFRYEVRTFRATYEGTGWYGRSFQIPDDWAGKRIWINFGSVSPTAEVWINGVKVGEHHAPFVPFGFEITPVVNFGQNNIVVVRVCEQDRDLAMCFNYAGYWSGLYRDVELTATGDAWFTEFQIHPREETGELVVDAGVDGSLAGDEVWVRAFNYATGAQVAAWQGVVENGRFRGSQVISDVKKWSPDSPALYRVDVSLVRTGLVLDARSERTGFVRLAMEGKHFCINGETYYMRGSGDFHDMPETGSPDTSRDNWRKRLQTLRDYGYNYVRCQSFAPVPEYFEAADEVGLLVQAEMGMLGSWSGYSSYHGYPWPLPTPENYQRIKQQWDGVVLRDVNHPSANIYCMSNELSWSNSNRTEYPHIAWKCYRDTKLIKPTALVLFTDGGFNESLPMDFVNDDPDRDAKTTLPLIVHEFRWWASFPDPELASRYKALHHYSAEMAIDCLTRHGIARIAPEAVKTTQRLQYLEAKAKMEACRRDNPTLAGICHFNAMDVTASPQGIVDVFYERKYADVATWRQTNGDTVVLCGLGFTDRVVRPGETLKTTLYVSDFSHPALSTPMLQWRLMDGDTLVDTGTLGYEHEPYCTCRVGEIETVIPELRQPKMLRLEATVNEGDRSFHNHWTAWAFPEVTLADGIQLAKHGLVKWLDHLEEQKDGSWRPAKLIIADRMTEELANHLQNSGRAILAAGEGLVRASKTKGEGTYFFTPGACYATYEDNHHGTIIRNHPCFGDFPHEGFADWQFFRLIEQSPPVDLESLGLNEADPIMRIIHAYQVGRSLGYVLEYTVGEEGRLLITSLNLDPALPEARYLLWSMCQYLINDEFQPAPPLSEYSLELMIEAGSILT